MAGVLAIYGLASVAYGSGFLAVFVAWIFIGDETRAYKREITRVPSIRPQPAELTAFVLLGLTIDLGSVGRNWAWLTGLLLAALLALVIRPLLVGLLLWPVRAAAARAAVILGPSRRGADPARHRDRVLRGARDRMRLRGHLRGGGVLRRGPGQYGAGRRPPAEDPDDGRRGRALVYRAATAARARRCAPAARPVRQRRGRYRHRGPRSAGGRLGQPGHPRRPLVPAQASTTLHAGDETLVLAGDDQDGDLAALFARRD